MIRTIVISTLALAFAGAANATEVVKVSLAGKTEAVIKAELVAAAKSVCSERLPHDYDSCVSATLDEALQHFERLKATKTASLAF